MKALRLFTIITLAMLVLSALGPAPVYAKQANSASEDTISLTLDLAKNKLARLRVNNRTGGTLYIRFSGDRSYSFSTSKQGKSTFESIIQPGKYTVTVTSSACSGELSYKRKVKGGTVSLPPFRCK